MSVHRPQQMFFPHPWRPGMQSALLFLVPFALAIALATSGLSLVNPPMTLAAEDNKPAKKKKPDTSVKPEKPKIPKSKSGAATKGHPRTAPFEPREPKRSTKRKRVTATRRRSNQSLPMKARSAQK